MGQQYSHLSSEERILIEKLHCEQHLSVRKIAEEIGRDKSTVSRELRRGLWFASNENGSYRPYRPKRLKTGPWTLGPFYSALAAQRKADLRRRGSRKPRRMDSDRLRAWVLDSLRRGWSPELIEGRLKAQYACVCSIESGPCERVDVFHVSGRFWSTSACGEKRTPARPAWTSFPS